MKGRKWVITIVGWCGLVGVLFSAGGCDFSQLIVSSLTGSLTGSSSTSETAITTFSSPTSPLNDMLTSETGDLSTGVLPSADPSPTLQELLNGPVATP